MARNAAPKPISLLRGGRIIPDDSKYIRGRVEIKEPGEETGAHVTGGKEEVLIILEGTATVFFGKAKLKVPEGASLFIGEGVLHNVRNAGRKRLRYVYVRSLGGDDHHGGHLH